MKRTVYYVSDSTGITARSFGRSLLTQFDGVEVVEHTIPYIDDREKAEQAIAQINQTYQTEGQRPLIFATMVNREILTMIHQSSGTILDFFHGFIGPLEQELGIKSSHSIGKAHSVKDINEYVARIGAIDYTLTSDDGNNTRHYDKADFILIGVSRCGKTPTSLYMAMQYGVKVANYPFTPEDMGHLKLPDFLASHKEKLFGLTIDAKRLHAIRTERRANSQYARLNQCQSELRQVEQLYSQYHIPFINTTMRSIEEISAYILNSVDNP